MRYGISKEGVHVIINGRHKKTLDLAQQHIQSISSAPVEKILADITTTEGQKKMFKVSPKTDILVINAGGPPFGPYTEFSRNDFQEAFANNVITHIELTKHYIHAMMEQQFGRIINITSASAKSPLQNLDLSNVTRIAVSGFSGTLKQTLIEKNITINCLLPGTHATERLKNLMKTQGKKTENTKNKIGNPDDFGQICAFLCSQQACHITGQNLLIDGGLFPGYF